VTRAARHLPGQGQEAPPKLCDAELTRLGEVTTTIAVEEGRPGAPAAGGAPAGKISAEVTVALVVPAGMSTWGCALSKVDEVPEQVTAVPAML
jgi:hypothetical protein